MSGPVDVLAIGVVTAIDNCAYYLREEAGLAAAAEQMEAVSAAVAKLIEADKEYDQIRWKPYDRNDPVACRQARDEFNAVSDRRAAALARVQGGAA